MPRLPSRTAFKPANALRRGPPILVETDNYILRSMRESDAESPFMDWLTDEDILRGLNIPPRGWTSDTLRRFISSFDALGRHLVGICDRKSGALVGFYTLDINLFHRTSQITAAIGDREYVGKNVLYEATPVLIRYLFSKRGVDKVSARVLASNRRVLFNFMIPDVFVYEARLKQEVIAPDGNRADILVFSSFKRP